MKERVEIRVPPYLGEGVTELLVAEWVKQPREEVHAHRPLVVLETAELSLELDAPEDGVIVAIFKQTGESIQPGQALAIFQPCEVTPPPPLPHQPSCWDDC